MSDLNKALEDIAGTMGMQIGDTVEPQETAQQETPAEPQPQEETVQPVQENIQQEEATVETPPQSSLQEEEISDEEIEATMLEYLSERLGREVSILMKFKELKIRLQKLMSV